MDFWTAWCERPVDGGPSLAQQLLASATRRFGRDAEDAVQATCEAVLEDANDPATLLPLPKDCDSEWLSSAEPDLDAVKGYLFTILRRQYRPMPVVPGSRRRRGAAAAPGEAQPQPDRIQVVSIDDVRLGLEREGVSAGVIDQFLSSEGAVWWLRKEFGQGFVERLVGRLDLGGLSPARVDANAFAAWLAAVLRVRAVITARDVFDRISDRDSCLLYTDLLLAASEETVRKEPAPRRRPGQPPPPAPPLGQDLRVRPGTQVFAVPPQVADQYAADQINAGQPDPGGNAARDFEVAFHHAFWRAIGEVNRARPSSAVLLAAWRMLCDADDALVPADDTLPDRLFEVWELHRDRMAALANPRPARRAAIAPPVVPADLVRRLPHHWGEAVTRRYVLAQARRLAWACAVGLGTVRVVNPPTDYFTGS